MGQSHCWQILQWNRKDGLKVLCLWGWCGWRAQWREGRVSTLKLKTQATWSSLQTSWFPCSEFTREKGFGDEISLLILLKTHLWTQQEIVPWTGVGKAGWGWLCAQVWTALNPISCLTSGLLINCKEFSHGEWMQVNECRWSYKPNHEVADGHRFSSWNWCGWLASKW